MYLLRRRVILRIVKDLCIGCWTSWPCDFIFLFCMVKWMDPYSLIRVESYKRNGILPMLERNAAVKLVPQRWQENVADGIFNVVITFEERVFDMVVEGNIIVFFTPFLSDWSDCKMLKVEWLVRQCFTARNRDLFIRFHITL